MTGTVDAILNKLWHDTNNPSSLYADAKRLRAAALKTGRVRGLSLGRVQRWLRTQPAYALFRQPSARGLPRGVAARHFAIHSRPGALVQLDTMALTKRNLLSSTFKFAIIIYDMFSTCLSIQLVRTNTSAAAARAFERALNRPPFNSVHVHACLTDNGSEFKGRAFERLCEQLHIQHRRTLVRAPWKAAGAERVIRTIRMFLSKWVHDAQRSGRERANIHLAMSACEAAHNASTNSVLPSHMTPTQALVRSNWERVLLYRLESRAHKDANHTRERPRFLVGQAVRVRTSRINEGGRPRLLGAVGTKSSDQSYSTQTFIIVKIRQTPPTFSYSLRGTVDERLLPGSFDEVSLIAAE